MPLVITGAVIVLLLVLVMTFRVHPFVALALASATLAFALGVPAGDIVGAVQDGFGDTLAGAGLIFGFGAILGRLLGDAGGSRRIAETLIDRVGHARAQVAVVVAALILGFALFFEVGIVLLVPIVYQVARRAGVGLLWLGLPMATGLSVMHGFLPPTPGPTVVSLELGAPLGEVLLYGAGIAVLITFVVGLGLPRVAIRWAPTAFQQRPGGVLAAIAGSDDDQEVPHPPGFAISALTALFPVLLLVAANVVTVLAGTGVIGAGPVVDTASVVGQPTVVMLLSVLFAMWTMGLARGRTMRDIGESAESAAKAVGMLVLILGISGSLKEVLLVGGVGDYVVDLVGDTGFPPLLLAWLVAALFRTAQGSATVAALSSVGIVLPLLAASAADPATAVNPALVALAIGAGSLFASHVNDTGFWIVKESFGLTVRETFATWTVMQTLVSLLGLGATMLLSLVV